MPAHPSDVRIDPQVEFGHSERAHRILDATRDLTLRWGYDKTTIDDIARASDVAKGTVYLHWRSREDLFAALLRRERLLFVTTMRRRLEHGPEPATIRRLLFLTAEGFIGHPVLRAVFVQDQEIIGKLLRRKHEANDVPSRTVTADYFQALQELEAIRTDLSVERLLAIHSSIFVGFFATDPLLPPDLRVPDSELASLVADALGRALDGDRELGPDGATAVADTTIDYARRAAELAQAKFDQIMRGEENADR